MCEGVRGLAGAAPPLHRTAYVTAHYARALVRLSKLSSLLTMTPAPAHGNHSDTGAAGELGLWLGEGASVSHDNGLGHDHDDGGGY